MMAAFDPSSWTVPRLRIDREGTWYHEDQEVTHEGIVASLREGLRVDAGGHYLQVGPARVPVAVEDAPFVGVRVDRHESGGHQVILVTTNVGDVVAVDEAHPLRVVTDRQTGEPSTYVRVRGGLEARLGRPAWYDLVSLAQPDPGEAGTMSVASSGASFSIGRVA